MLVNSKELLLDAKKNGYAISHFNINNLEWTKYILEAMQEIGQPVILGVSEGAKKYMGGFYTVSSMVNGLLRDLKITIPVVLHLDHGTSFSSCKEAIDAGFTSVMIDASSYPFEENVRITREVVEYAHPLGVSVEAELGHIGGSEDNITSSSTNATLEESIEFVRLTGVDSFAPSLGSVHGLYRVTANLDFDKINKIHENVDVPLVLHGASGIEEEKIKRAISCGISKINVNTEFQIAWHNEVLKFVKEHPDAYDPRLVIASGSIAIKNAVKEKCALFSKEAK